MDSLSIRVSKNELWTRGQTSHLPDYVTEFYINERNLLEIINKEMAAYGCREHGYIGVDFYTVFLTNIALYHGTEFENLPMTLLYVCAGCGLPDFHCIEVRITDMDHEVRWDFFRANSFWEEPGQEGDWCRMLDIPPFFFDKVEYQNALLVSSENLKSERKLALKPTVRFDSYIEGYPFYTCSSCGSGSSPPEYGGRKAKGF